MRLVEQDRRSGEQFLEVALQQAGFDDLVRDPSLRPLQAAARVVVHVANDARLTMTKTRPAAAPGP